MKSTHLSKTIKVKKVKKEKEKTRSRFMKNGYEIFKDGKFNLEPAPWGFNWFLGYCEQPTS